MTSMCKNTVSTAHLSSPVGRLELQTCRDGVHYLKIVGVTSDEDFKPDKSQAVSIEKHSSNVPKFVEESRIWLDNFFHSPKKAAKQQPPAICHLLHSSNKAPFTQNVWHTLLTEISFGETVSYGGLAVKCGSSTGASRAVGQAMKNNPVSLIIPCHRVIKSDGATGNYSGGKKNSVKMWLLEHEKGEAK